MRLVRLRLVACAALLALALAAAAPATAQVRGTGHVSFGLAVPDGEFDNNLDGPGFGFNGFIGAAFDGSPFVVGLDLGFFIYGRTTDNVPFSTTVGPRVSVDVITTNSIVQPHLAVRAQPVLGLTRPYLEVLGGFKYLFTETRVEDEGFDDDEDGEIASSRNFDDFAWSYGAGAGIDFDFYRIGTTRLGLHIGVQYLFGSEAEYLKEGELIDEDSDGELDREELGVRRSQTDLIVPQLGVSFRF
jgi:hypothetical protein